MTRIVANKSDYEIEMAALKQHPLFRASPEEIDEWMDENVTDTASAREALKVIAKLLILRGYA